MRVGAFRYVSLALAVSACAQSDAPISKFETVTIELPQEAAAQLGNTGRAVPLPKRKPDPSAVAKATSQPERGKQASRAASRAQVREQAAPTLTPEGTLLTAPEGASPALASQNDPQDSAPILPRMPNLRQMGKCEGTGEADCKGLSQCKWVAGYSVGPGVYVDGYCDKN